MKKIFEEPQMRRIELNINENIANSSSGEVKYVFQTRMEQLCLVENTNFNVLHILQGTATDAELMACIEHSQTFSMRRGVTYVTKEEIFGL